MAAVGRRSQPFPEISFAKVPRSNSLSGEFAEAVRASWAFFLLLQSECRSLGSRLSVGRMDEDSALESPAFFGMWKGQLVIKPHKRKHVPGGSQVARNYTCDKYPAQCLEVRAPLLFRPVFSLWGRVYLGVRAGQQMSAAFAGQKFANRARGVDKRFGSGRAKRLGAHST